MMLALGARVEVGAGLAVIDPALVVTARLGRAASGPGPRLGRFFDLASRCSRWDRRAGRARHLD
jgi:hypothetical protein